jgi:uncharacterized protein YigA (DUF484 family)
MNDAFYHHQTEKTLRNLENENRRLHKEIRETRQESDRIRALIAFHDRLEKDFFSADSLEELVITLTNCLQLRPGIDFVTLGLTRQYLESSLGCQEFVDQLSMPRGLEILPIMEEEDLKKHLGGKPALFEKTPLGSSMVFFPGHHDEIRSHALLPLTLRKRLIGSLNLPVRQSIHLYSTVEGLILNRLVAKLAIAVDNLLSHRRVFLQKHCSIRRFAGSPPSRGPLALALVRTRLPQIAAYFQPRHELGGDFYDFLLWILKDRPSDADVSGRTALPQRSSPRC